MFFVNSRKCQQFKSNKYLGRAIQFCYGYKNGGPVPNYVMGGLRLVGSAPSNFRPMNAKAIWERFAPENGVVFDSSAGFGGRLLGALSSKKRSQAAKGLRASWSHDSPE